MNFTIDKTTSNGNLFVIGKNFYYPGNSVLSSQQSNTTIDNIVITLPTPVTAFGVDFGSFGTPTLSFLLSNGTSFTRTEAALPNLNFVGFTSSTPFNTIRLSQPIGDVLNIDNFSFGAKASAVPEPGTTPLLFSTGTLFAGAASRRFLRRKK